MTFGFKRFGFDLDNTIINYRISVAKYCHYAKLPKQETIKDLRSFLRKIDPTDLKWQEAQSWIYTNGIEFARLNEGVEDLCVYLQDKNISMSIVSHKTGKTQDRLGGQDLFNPIVNWIKLSKLKEFFKINENIYFLPTRDAKIQKIDKLHLNWFVDDLLEVLIDRNFPIYTAKFLLSNEEYPDLSPEINVIKELSLIKNRLEI